MQQEFKDLQSEAKCAAKKESKCLQILLGATKMTI